MAIGMGLEMTIPPPARGESDEDFLRRNMSISLRAYESLNVAALNAAAAGAVGFFFSKAES